MKTQHDFTLTAPAGRGKNGTGYLYANKDSKGPSAEV
jgi:hypothetical protein